MASSLKFLRNRFFIAAALVMVLGALAAAVIFIMAEVAEINPSADSSDGTVYVSPPEDTKRYRHDLERFGGKAAVMADDLNRWFASLWQGKRLAATVGVLAFLLALMLFHAGKRAEDSKEADDAQVR